MLYRPHRLYLFLLVAWLTIIVIAPPLDVQLSLAAGTIILGVIAAFYFQYSSSNYAARLLEQAAQGNEKARRVYLARAQSKLGDVAREYLETLLKAGPDERLLPLVVKQLDHPDVLAREKTEDRLGAIGSPAAEFVVQAVVARELGREGAYRARRLLFRWRPELPQSLQDKLESIGYWQAEAA